MRKSTKTIELKFERTIPASSSEVYDAWLNPRFLGTLWRCGPLADLPSLEPLLLSLEVKHLVALVVLGEAYAPLDCQGKAFGNLRNLNGFEARWKPATFLWVLRPR